MLEWLDDLKIRGTDLFLDSRRPRGLCFVSHAHSDHIGCHECAVSTRPTAELIEHRIGIRTVQLLEYRQTFNIDESTSVQLLPAGHVLGSAMIHVTRPEGTLLYTGDFKLRPSLTSEQAEVVPADVLVMESTFGQPFFRFPPWQDVAGQMLDLVDEAFGQGRQPVLLGYTLGKAQEIIRICTDAGLNVTLHGAVHAVSRIYERLGTPLGAFRRYAFEDFHGPKALDLRERGVLVAPPNVARSGFVQRFGNAMTIMLSGWALLKNARFRYGVDHVLPLSDHADFDELLELIERVSPKVIYTHHGYKEFAEILKARGHVARLARPEAQLSLFD